MRKIRKHALADADLIGIWRYTYDRWGSTQADSYLDELGNAIAQLANNPEIGAKRDQVRDGYRVLFAGRHAIYYTITATAVHIIRVLHSQMDPDRYL